MTILDIKTGKAMPWTAIQTAGYMPLDAPVDFHKDGHIYTHDGARLESVTGILQAEGFIDPTWYTEEARVRGSYVHLARHLDDAGELDEESLDPVIVPYLQAWRKFKRESGFIIERSEVPMMSTAYRYAGTPDVVGRFPSGCLKRAAVELHNDGGYRLIPFTDRQDLNLWLSVLAVHNWKRNNMRRAA